MLRHTLATLAYRAAKVLRDAPNGFEEFRQDAGSRSAEEILAHMGDLMDWGASIARGAQTWSDSTPQAWDDEVQRFFFALATFNNAITELPPDEALANKLFQGPIADALTHVGQLAMMRRLARAPIKGENYFVAAIGQLTEDQPPPKKEF